MIVATLTLLHLAVSWRDIGLHPHIADTCHSLGYHAPTPLQVRSDCPSPAAHRPGGWWCLQQRVVPQTLIGKNVLCSAPTGSGKTTAWCLAVLHQMVTSSAHSASV